MARSVMCGYCYGYGHNKRGCPKMKEDAKNGNKYAQRLVDAYKAKSETQKSLGGRKCGYCEERGHTRRTCPQLKEHKAISERLQREWRGATLEYFKSIGLGAGALIRSEHSQYISGRGRVDGPHIGLVTGIHWESLNHRAADKYSSNRNIVKAILTVAPGSEVYLAPPADDLLINSTYSEGIEVIGPVTASAVEAQVPSDWLTADLPEGWFDKDSKGWNWQDNTFDDGRFAKRQAELTETSN